MEIEEKQFACPECGETEMIDLWVDHLARGYQCLKTDCMSSDVLEEF